MSSWGITPTRIDYSLSTLCTKEYFDKKVILHENTNTKFRVFLQKFGGGGCLDNQRSPFKNMCPVLLCFLIKGVCL
jgi:hypothetical protein